MFIIHTCQISHMVVIRSGQLWIPGGDLQMKSTSCVCCCLFTFWVDSYYKKTQGGLLIIPVIQFIASGTLIGLIP